MQTFEEQTQKSREHIHATGMSTNDYDRLEAIYLGEYHEAYMKEDIGGNPTDRDYLQRCDNADAIFVNKMNTWIATTWLSKQKIQ